MRVLCIHAAITTDFFKKSVASVALFSIVRGRLIGFDTITDVRDYRHIKYSLIGKRP